MKAKIPQKTITKKEKDQLMILKAKRKFKKCIG